MTHARWRIVVLIAYLAVLAGIVYGLDRARAWSIAAYSDSEAQSHWESFRDDIAQQDRRAAPVRRRVPRSGEPPALVLMRDHFAICCVIAIVLTSALFATFTFFLGGILTQPNPEASIRDP